MSLKNKSYSKSSSLNHQGVTLNDPVQISEIFNNFFTNVGPNIAKQIPKTSKKFYEFLKNRMEKSVYFKLTHKDEIVKIINNLKKGKALGPNSIPTHILKFNVEVLSDPSI